MLLLFTLTSLPVSVFAEEADPAQAVPSLLAETEEPAEPLVLSDTKLSLFVREQAVLTVSPASAAQSIVWSSSNPEVAEVDADGRIDAISPGTAVITAAAGNSQASCTVTVRLATPVVKAASASYNRVKVSWKKIPGADGYLIYRKNASGNWKKLATVAAAQISYTDTGLTCGVSYTYTVKAYADNLYSAYNKTGVSAKPVPATPSPKAASASYHKIKVSWNQISGANGYFVYRKNAAGDWKKIATLTGGKTLSYTDSGLNCGTSYTYTVKAYRTIDGKKVSGAYHAAGASAKPRLGTPKVSVSKAGDTAIKVSWKQVSGANGYLVYRKNAAGDWKKIGSVSGGKTLSYTDKRRDPGVSYSYTVKAYRKVGQKKVYSGYSSSGANMKLPFPAPKLRSVSSNKKPNNIVLKWSAVPGAQGYRIYRKIAGGSWETLRDVSGQATTSYTDKTAKDGVEYLYTVRAYCQNGKVLSSYKKAGISAQLVYWSPTSNAKCYHKTICASLKNSKTVLYGLVSESGKTAACKNCYH